MAPALPCVYTRLSYKSAAVSLRQMPFVLMVAGAQPLYQPR